jgi:antagonist of KipI
MSLVVIKPGVFSTIQDQGRSGFSKWGINPGGAIDRYASRIANALVGNPLESAVIEMHFPAGQMQFGESVLMCITGADFEPTIDGSPLPLWRPVIVPVNSVLSFKRKKSGERCYLAVRGGFQTSKWMGSFSTNVKIRAGGYEGRTLSKGDIVSYVKDPAIKTPLNEIVVLPWAVNPVNIYGQPNEFFLLRGNEWDLMTADGRELLLSTAFAIHPSSDRMAYHLKNTTITTDVHEQLLSTAVTFGTIQALPGGNLLILMADHQTTGGYPRIAHVVSAHLPKLSQRGPNDLITFKEISIDQAEKMVISLEQELKRVSHSCNNNLRDYHAKHRSQL